jgi:hypothetical protein
MFPFRLKKAIKTTPKKRKKEENFGFFSKLSNQGKSFKIVGSPKLLGNALKSKYKVKE